MKKIIVKNLLEEENKKLKEENKLLMTLMETLLKSKNGLLQYNIPMQTNIIKNGEWCHCGYWKQYGMPDNHFCTGYKVTC